MGAPQYGEDTRADLESTGILFDQARSSSSAGNLANMNQGTQAAQGLLKPSTQFDKGLGSDPMSSAIQQKYQQQYGVKSRMQQHADKHQAEADHFNKLEQTHRLVADEQQMNYNKRMEKYKREQAAKRARGAVVGQVLGVAGAVVAGIYSGGTGAAAGYAAGSAVGGAIGGE